MTNHLEKRPADIVPYSPDFAQWQNGFKKNQLLFVPAPSPSMSDGFITPPKDSVLPRRKPEDMEYITDDRGSLWQLSLAGGVSLAELIVSIVDDDKGKVELDMYEPGLIENLRPSKSFYQLCKSLIDRYKMRPKDVFNARSRALLTIGRLALQEPEKRPNVPENTELQIMQHELLGLSTKLLYGLINTHLYRRSIGLPRNDRENLEQLYKRLVKNDQQEMQDQTRQAVRDYIQRSLRSVRPSSSENRINSQAGRGVLKKAGVPPNLVDEVIAEVVAEKIAARKSDRAPAVADVSPVKPTIATPEDHQEPEETETIAGHNEQRGILPDYWHVSLARANRYRYIESFGFDVYNSPSEVANSAASQESDSIAGAAEINSSTSQAEQLVITGQVTLPADSPQIGGVFETAQTDEVVYFDGSIIHATGTARSVLELLLAERLNGPLPVYEMETLLGLSSGEITLALRKLEQLDGVSLRRGYDPISDTSGYYLTAEQPPSSESSKTPLKSNISLTPHKGVGDYNPQSIIHQFRKLEPRKVEREPISPDDVETLDDKDAKIIASLLLKYKETNITLDPHLPSTHYGLTNSTIDLLNTVITTPSVPDDKAKSDDNLVTTTTTALEKVVRLFIMDPAFYLKKYWDHSEKIRPLIEFIRQQNALTDIVSVIITAYLKEAENTIPVESKTDLESLRDHWREERKKRTSAI